MEDNTQSLKRKVTMLDICVLIFGIILYILDVASDIYVAFSNWYLHSDGFFIASVVFIILPSVVNSLLSWMWYRENHEELTKMAVFMHLILLSPLMRYIQTLRFAIKAYSKKKDDDFERFFKNLSDLSILQFLEAFLEAGPQLTMQVSVLIPGRYPVPEIRWFRYASIMVSLISLSWSSVSYHRTRRRASSRMSDDIHILVWCLQFSWTLLFTAFRIFFLSSLLSVCPLWLLAGCLLHVVFILVYIMTCICSEIFEYSVSDYALLLFWSFVTIFVPILYHKSDFTFHTSTDLFNIYYFLISFLENLFISLVWSEFFGLSDYAELIIFIYVHCFTFGILLMTVQILCTSDSLTMMKREQLSGNTVESGNACNEENP